MWRPNDKLGLFIVPLLMAIVCVSCTSAKGDDKLSTFVLQVPTNWQSASQIRLTLEGITVPGNVPLKLRVTTGREGNENFLGSTGIEALGREESKPHHVRALKLDVTRSLKRVLEEQHDTNKIQLRIQAVDGRNKPIQGLKWSCDKVRLEISESSTGE